MGNEPKNIDEFVRKILFNNNPLFYTDVSLNFSNHADIKLFFNSTEFCPQYIDPDIKNAEGIEILSNKFREIHENKDPVASTMYLVKCIEDLQKIENALFEHLNFFVTVEPLQNNKDIIIWTLFNIQDKTYVRFTNSVKTIEKVIKHYNSTHNAYSKMFKEMHSLNLEDAMQIKLSKYTSNIIKKYKYKPILFKDYLVTLSI